MAAEITINTTPPPMTGTGIVVDGQVAKAMPAPSTPEQEAAAEAEAERQLLLAEAIERGEVVATDGDTTLVAVPS